jgi:cytoskeletal protein RodZ
MFEIGNSLREARLRQGLEFPEIEYATKVRSKYLRALEDEQFDVLPAQTYVKGFLRTYAEYLGLDGQLYVDEYNSRYVGVEEESPLRASMRQPTQQERRFAGGVVLAAVAGIAVVTALVIAAWRFGTGSNSPTKTPAAANHKAKKQQKKAHKTAARSVSVQIQATHGYGSYIVARVSSPGGRQLYAGTLEPGKIQTFRSSKIWFRIDAPANVIVSVNGKRRALPGQGYPRMVVASPGGRLQLASAAG